MTSRSVRQSLTVEQVLSQNKWKDRQIKFQFYGDGPHTAPTLDLLDEALERAWSRRGEWRELGINAGRRIRTIISEDRISDFIAQIASNHLDID